MENVIIFEMDFGVSENIDKTTKDLIKKWLIDYNNLDVVVSSLCLGEIWSISIDCIFLQNKADKFKAQKLTEQFLKRFEIPYRIVEN